MNSRLTLLHAVCIAFAMSPVVKADDWILSRGKGTIKTDPAYSKQLDDPSLSVDSGPWNALRAITNPDSIPTAGKTFVSPDKRFSVETEIADQEFHLVITDAQTGSMRHLANALCPIFALQWSPDSKTLLAIEHASETSVIGLTHWDGHHWLQFEIDGPEVGNNDKVHVTGWEYKSHYLETTYLIDDRADNGDSGSFYKCTFRIDPASGKTADVTKTKITRLDFLALRNASN